MCYNVAGFVNNPLTRYGTQKRASGKEIIGGEFLGSRKCLIKQSL
jgi:pyocin large subunit-like protein